MFDDNVSKRSFWTYINKKIKHTVHQYHVLSVISILFDEMRKDLKAGKEIKIHNFGTIALRQTNPKRYHDVRFNRVMQSQGHKIMRMTLTKKFKKRLCSLLNIDATFGDEK